MSEESEKFTTTGDVLSTEEMARIAEIDFTDVSRVVRKFDEEAPARLKGLLRARKVPREI